MEQTTHETYSDIKRKLRMLMDESITHNRERLRNLLRSQCVKEDQNGFVLKSGEVSPFYIDVKKGAQHPVGGILIAKLIHDMITTSGREISHVGGKVTGGMLISQSIVTLSALTDYPVQGFYVRDMTKEYATKTKVEGLRRGDRMKKVVVVDDVSTTGGSIADAIETIRDKTPPNGIGADVAFAVSVVDRQKGNEVERRTGVKLAHIFTERDILYP